jgi:heme/copper-type cytochrome/quinol oxidase subunit 3
MHLRAGRWTNDFAASFLILPIGDMILFGSFFGAAMAYRHKPEIHKRLIIAATVALAFAAVARLNLPLLPFFLLWLAPMAMAMAFDMRTLGRVHTVNAISTAVMVIAFGRVLLMETEGWRAIGRVILAPFL